MITIDAFLERVLPSEGYYCVVVFKGGKPHHIFKPTLGGMVDEILVNDANGHTVYHACATFKSPDSRKTENVKFLRSLWLDIDVGFDKKRNVWRKYREQDEAKEAVAALSRASRLPDPVLVDSGYGLHCYWPMAENVERLRWQPLADYFRGLCVSYELAADHQITGNSAAILRPVGTHNRKEPGQERLVRCL